MLLVLLLLPGVCSLCTLAKPCRYLWFIEAGAFCLLSLICPYVRQRDNETAEYEWYTQAANNTRQCNWPSLSLSLSLSFFLYFFLPWLLWPMATSLTRELCKLCTPFSPWTKWLVTQCFGRQTFVSGEIYFTHWRTQKEGEKEGKTKHASE